MGSPELSTFLKIDESVRYKALLIDAIVALCSNRFSEQSKHSLKEVSSIVKNGYSVILLSNHLSHFDVPLIQKAVDTIRRQSKRNIPQYWFTTTRLDPTYFDDFQNDSEVAAYRYIHASGTLLPEYALMKEYLTSHKIKIFPVAQPKDIWNRTIPHRIKRIMMHKSDRMFEDSLRQLEKNQMLLGLFPEGQRSEDGLLGTPTETTNAYLSSLPEKTIVLPLAIKGTNELYPKDGSSFNISARMQLTVLPPILSSELKDRSQPANDIFDDIAQALKESP